MKDQSIESIHQMAWECGFMDMDVPKLIKFAGLVRADSFSAGFESGLNYQRMMSIKTLESAIDELRGGNHV